jgi:hypothetical protein
MGSLTIAVAMPVAAPHASHSSTNHAARTHSASAPTFANTSAILGAEDGLDFGARAVLQASALSLYGPDAVEPAHLTLRVSAGQAVGVQAWGVESLPGYPVTIAVGVSSTTLQHGLTPASASLPVQISNEIRNVDPRRPDPAKFSRAVRKDDGVRYSPNQTPTVPGMFADLRVIGGVLT